MSNGTSRSWDDDEFADADSQSAEIGSAFDLYTKNDLYGSHTESGEIGDSRDDGGIVQPPNPSVSGDEHLPLWSSVTNPPGTVTVTVFPDGRIRSIALSPGVVRMSERQLEDEIQVVADLAWRHARSEVHEFAVEVARRTGFNDSEMGHHLAKNAGLPSRADVEALKSQIFSTRYYGDTD